MDNNTLLAIAPNLAQPHFEEVPSVMLEEWAGETWPVGDWHQDRISIDGLDPILRALQKGHDVTFVAYPVGPGALEVREAGPLTGSHHHTMVYPPRGARGPQAQATEHGMERALHGYIVSRALLAGWHCIRVVPTLAGFEASVLL